MKESGEGQSTQYQSYLLRMWRNGEDGEWRALLLTIPTQERRHFASLQDLFDFLKDQSLPMTIMNVPEVPQNGTLMRFSDTEKELVNTAQE
ncbi:MAG: hypothetical protein ACOYYS_14115 [Chloroflexota bacterium]